MLVAYESDGDVKSELLISKGILLLCICIAEQTFPHDTHHPHMRVLNGQEHFQVAHFKVHVARESCMFAPSRVFEGGRKIGHANSDVAVIRDMNVVTTTKSGSSICVVVYR